MAVDEVVNWEEVPKENPTPMPPGPDGRRPARVALTLQEIMASIARWRNTLLVSGAAVLDDLGDVSNVGPVDKNVIVYDGLTDLRYENRFLNVTDINPGTVPTDVFVGRDTPGVGSFEVMNSAAATSILDLFTSALKGLVPASGGGTVNYLRADGAFAQPPGAAGSVTSIWQYDDSTGAADPGSGNFRTDNNTIASSTQIYINDENKNGFDASVILENLSIGGFIYLQNGEDSSEHLLAKISGVTDNTGWFTLDITVTDSSGPTWTDGKEFGFILNLGSVGPQLNTVSVTTTSYTAENGDVVLCKDDTAGSAITVTLPDAAEANQFIAVKKQGSTAEVIVDGDGVDNIDGELTYTLILRNESINLVSDGSGWSII